jgi:hypothetical protein
MKLCPQCDFIYEDDQSFCDMDGKELVHKRSSESRFKLVIPIAPAVAAEPIAPPSAARRSNGFIVAVLAVVILATLVVLAYFARARRANAGLVSGATVESAQQSDPNLATPSQSSDTSSADTTNSPATDQVSTNPSDPAEDVQSTSKTALAHSRLNAGPVAASATTSDRGLVIVHLTNGTSIRADEAWEKREGVWYRQQGVVTFLKRSQVRSIERLPSRSGDQRNNSVAGSNTVASGTSGNGTARTTRPARQQQISQSQPAPKKQSGVTSFLKKTGNFIKKPFRF